jgi:Cu/Ag efflux pump CusA
LGCFRWQLEAVIQVVKIEGPMAIVILSGLFTSTALNLLILPRLALRCGKFHRSTEQQI